MIDRAKVPIRRRKEARPGELLAAAMTLFIEKGFTATRTEEIAERAGVTKGTLYLYFSSKEQLFTGLIAERFFCRFPCEGHEEELAAGSATAMLQGVSGAWQSALNEGRLEGVVKVVFTEVHQFPMLADFWVRQVMAPTRSVVRHAVERGIASSEFHDIDPDLVMNALVQPLIGICLHRQVISPYAACPFITGGYEPLARDLDWVVRGLASERASPPCQERGEPTPMPASNHAAVGHNADSERSLAGLSAQNLMPATPASAPLTGAHMKNRIVFALLMGSITTGLATFALIYLNLGFGSSFAKVWMRSWGLAYLIVIPIILAIAPRLRGLITRLFVAIQGVDSGNAHALPPKIAFALTMGFITTGVISCAVILMNLGFRDNFVHVLVRSWALGYAVVVPALLFVAPALERLVNKAFAPSP